MIKEKVVGKTIFFSLFVQIATTILSFKNNINNYL